MLSPNTARLESNSIITVEYFTSDILIDDYFVLKQALIMFIKQSIDIMVMKIANAGGDINIFNADGGGNAVTTTII